MFLSVQKSRKNLDIRPSILKNVNAISNFNLQLKFKCTSCHNILSLMNLQKLYQCTVEISFCKKLWQTKTLVWQVAVAVANQNSGLSSGSGRQQALSLIWRCPSLPPCHLSFHPNLVLLTVTLRPGTNTPPYPQSPLPHILFGISDVHFWHCTFVISLDFCLPFYASDQICIIEMGI